MVWWNPFSKPDKSPQIPQDKVGIIAYAAENIPWVKTASGYAGITAKEAKPYTNILDVCFRHRLADVLTSRNGDTLFAASAELETAIKEIKGLDVHAANDKANAQQNVRPEPLQRSGADLMRSGDERKGHPLS